MVEEVSLGIFAGFSVILVSVRQRIAALHWDAIVDFLLGLGSRMLLCRCDLLHFTGWSNAFRLGREVVCRAVQAARGFNGNGAQRQGDSTARVLNGKGGLRPHNFL
jgi:hypothetical protein